MARMAPTHGKSTICTLGGGGLSPKPPRPRARAGARSAGWLMIGFWWSRQYLAGQPCEVAEQGVYARARLGRSSLALGRLVDPGQGPLWLVTPTGRLTVQVLYSWGDLQLVRRTAPANTATLGNADSVCGGTA
eukprot:gene14344-biopygen15657